MPMSDGAVRFGPPDDVLVAHFSGEIDLSNAEELGLRVAQAAPGDALGVVLDLTEVEYIDSYGIFVIHGLRQRLAENQQTLALVVPGDARIRRAIEMVGISDVLPIKEDLEEATRTVLQSGL
jgi:anti-sigma B factor antagonist